MQKAGVEGQVGVVKQDEFFFKASQNQQLAVLQIKTKLELGTLPHLVNSDPTGLEREEEALPASVHVNQSQLESFIKNYFVALYVGYDQLAHPLVFNFEKPKNFFYKSLFLICNLETELSKKNCFGGMEIQFAVGNLDYFNRPPKFLV